MLSIFNAIFLINTLIVPPACTGVACNVNNTENRTYSVVAPQEIVIASEVSPSAARDGISVALQVQTTYASNSNATAILVPPGSIIEAASRYVGYNWDCTRLVEQALRDLGYSVPDLGPMGFGAYGAVFNDPNQVKPGNIMMRGGHVAIYVGDGYSIQGGYNGRVVVVADSPNMYSSFVSLN